MKVVYQNANDIWIESSMFLIYFFFFFWLSGKRGKEKREKGENNGEQKEDFVKKRWKIGNGRRKSYKMKRRPFFLLLLLFFFLSFYISKRLKFGLGLPKWKFATGKKHFTPGEKCLRKNDFAPSEKFSCYAPGLFHAYLNLGLHCVV